MGMEGLPTSPEPGGHTGGSRRPGRRGAPGPATGGLGLSVIASELHCGSLNFTLVVSVNSGVSDLTEVHRVRADSLVTLR